MRKKTFVENVLEQAVAAALAGKPQRAAALAGKRRSPNNMIPTSKYKHEPRTLTHYTARNLSTMFQNLEQKVNEKRRQLEKMNPNGLKRGKDLHLCPYGKQRRADEEGLDGWQDNNDSIINNESS